MRRVLALFVALYVVAAVSPPRHQPEPEPLRIMSTVEWSDAAISYSIEQWYTTMANAPTTTVQVEGNQGAMRRQEVALDGDRFDRLAMCESGMRQDAVGGGGRYLSYFQWLLSTWHAAGGEGDPRDVDYATQKQIAMHWASVTNPASQWPVCWPRSA